MKDFYISRDFLSRLFLCAAFLLFSAGIYAQTIYIVTTTNDSGPGSLREAISLANGNAEKDIIQFQIPGPGPYVIAPTSHLGSITKPVIINGRTQIGYAAGDPIIEIDGRNAGNTMPGLQFLSTAAGSEVYGLSIYGYSFGNTMNDGGNAIQVRTSDMIISGNLIGIRPNGEVIRNTFAGVDILVGSNNLIGGNDEEDRNVISGNQIGINIGSFYGKKKGNIPNEGFFCPP